jgi:hypothetical protein
MMVAIKQYCNSGHYENILTSGEGLRTLLTSRALWQAHSSGSHRLKPLLNFINTKFLEDPFLNVAH